MEQNLNLALFPVEEVVKVWSQLFFSCERLLCGSAVHLAHDHQASFFKNS